MKIVIINLDKATERIAFQQQQMDKLGLAFTRLSADCPSHQCNFEKYQYSWERPMSFSEIAVFFNHKKIWEMAIEENSPILALEDDAYCATDISEILGKAEKLQNIEYLNLEARGNNQRKLIANNPTQRVDKTSFYKLYQGRSGAAGYIIWPSGAKKLLNRFKQGKIGIVDKFINAEYSLKAYQAEPAPLIQLDMCTHYGLTPPIETPSYIDANRREKRGSSKYWVYKIVRLKGQAKIAWNSLVHSRHAKKRAVRISDTFVNWDE